MSAADPEIAGIVIAEGAWHVLETRPGFYSPEAYCEAVDLLVSALIASANRNGRADIGNRVRVLLAEWSEQLEKTP